MAEPVLAAAVSLRRGLGVSGDLRSTTLFNPAAPRFRFQNLNAKETMIQTIKTKLRALLSNVLHALGMPFATSTPAETLRVVSEKLAIKAPVGHVPLASSSAISNRRFNLSKMVHSESAGRAGEIVAFEIPDDSIPVKGLDTGILREIAVATSPPIDMPKVPDTFYAVDLCFMTAMIEAAQTITAGQPRFAMDCIRLRGVDRQITASDSYQAFVQTGFQFPWSDEVLVISSTALASPDFLHARHLEIGRKDAWLFIPLEQQTLTLRIKKERLFTHLDLQVPIKSSVTTRVQVSPRDASFLASFTPRLPGVRAQSAPVTVDLNGVVAIRAADEEGSKAVDLVLDNSRYDGNRLRFQADRSYLLRAIQLGSRDVYLWNSGPRTLP